MIKMGVTTAMSLGLVGTAIGADLPRREPAPIAVAPVGKAPIGKGPIGKGPIGKAPQPIYTKG